MVAAGCKGINRQDKCKASSVLVAVIPIMGNLLVRGVLRQSIDLNDDDNQSPQNTVVHELVHHHCCAAWCVYLQYSVCHKRCA